MHDGIIRIQFIVQMKAYAIRILVIFINDCVGNCIVVDWKVLREKDDIHSNLSKLLNTLQTWTVEKLEIFVFPFILMCTEASTGFFSGGGGAPAT